METKMIDVIPEGKVGDARISHFTVNAFESTRSMMSNGGELYCPEGTYCCLHVKGNIVMSDTLHERTTNAEFIDKAHGDVLIGGLGIGYVVHEILDKPEVKSVTVVEINEDVLTLVEEHIEHPKLTIIEADINDWQPPEKNKFNAIWLDIWNIISSDHVQEMRELKARFRNYLVKKKEDPERFIGCWSQERATKMYYEEGLQHESSVFS